MPSGDQPSAIDALARALTAACVSKTLLGVTGSGKTYTMAKVIEKLNRLHLCLPTTNIGRAVMLGV